MAVDRAELKVLWKDDIEVAAWAPGKAALWAVKMANAMVGLKDLFEAVVSDEWWECATVV